MQQPAAQQALTQQRLPQSPNAFRNATTPSRFRQQTRMVPTQAPAVPSIATNSPAPGFRTQAPSVATQNSLPQPVAAPRGYVAQAAATQVAGGQQERALGLGDYIRQAGHQAPTDNADDARRGNANPNDFFNNPFGDARIPSNAESMPSAVRFAQGTAPAGRPGLPPMGQPPEVVPAAPQSQSILMPESLQNATPPTQASPGGAPALPAPENDLRGVAPQAEMPAPRAELPPQPPADSGLRDLLEQGGDGLGDSQTTPSEPNNESVQGTDSPSDRQGEDPVPYKNPFTQGNDSPQDGADAGPNLARPNRDVIAPNELSCEDFRQRIARDTIDQLTLDISPPFRPDVFDPEDYKKQRERFDRKQKQRDWSDVNGSTMATGRLVDLAYEKVVIENQSGVRQELALNRIGEADLAYLSENWGLPKECLVEQVAFTPRAWTPMTMTWTASNLCSKQRYYEQVNLERYGHTAGPVLQPIVSSAHFFANIAVTPYKMGIHPPNECHYALGYYRPGNCAPWIVPPVPISPRGALAQGAFVSGLYWLIP
ncbi:MAG: hypothetical protein AAFX06_31695 [Planctomycetota bacterium]